MSDNTPDKSELMRSNIVTILFTVILLVIALTLWAWSSPDVVDTSPVGAITEINPWLLWGIELVIMIGLFFFASLSTINLRLMISGIRAGWTEMIALIIVVTALAFFMFSPELAAATLVATLGILSYFYMIQR
ncbi:MAG: conserved membrane protein of unknown function [Candidatus Thorarchaeota archaeon]|nr:MAG: conserved membrane protein of unknown function [Candidatus Thorarchaeota archaeon]